MCEGEGKDERSVGSATLGDKDLALGFREPLELEVSAMVRRPLVLSVIEEEERRPDPRNKVERERKEVPHQSLLHHPSAALGQREERTHGGELARNGFEKTLPHHHRAALSFPADRPTPLHELGMPALREHGVKDLERGVRDVQRLGEERDEDPGFRQDDGDGGDEGCVCVSDGRKRSRGGGRTEGPGDESEERDLGEVGENEHGYHDCSAEESALVDDRFDALEELRVAEEVDDPTPVPSCQFRFSQCVYTTRTRGRDTLRCELLRTLGCRQRLRLP